MTAPNNTPLLPCPFCGSEAKWHSRVFMEVGCGSSRQDCIIGATVFRTDAWNRRAVVALHKSEPNK